MDLKDFMEIYRDNNSDNLPKMKHKYGAERLKQFLSGLKSSFYESINLIDAAGQQLVFLPEKVRPHADSFKLLHAQGPSVRTFGQKAMEDETAATFDIEGIDYNRESVRRIFAGYAPSNKMEQRIAGMKRGIEYIGNQRNTINEEHLFRLYKLAIWDSLKPEHKLLPNSFYRHDTVTVTDGTKALHTGLSHKKLPVSMKRLISYMQTGDKDELRKAAIIHFYLSYVHPYFDGNGRMARLMQMWYLIQRGYPGTMHVSLSKYIEATRRKYYRAFEQIEENAKISGVIDVTPFLKYMNENVYDQLPLEFPYRKSIEDYTDLVREGAVTEKERDLWQFVMSAYGSDEFSTKQLEKDFQNVAYATVRSFVMKFEDKGLLSRQSYGNRNKYRISVD